MSNNQPQQDETQNLLHDEKLYPFLEEGLKWSKQLQEHTPNWKQKLTSTIIPMILPISNLASSALDYHEEGIRPYDDLPEPELQIVAEAPINADQMWSSLSTPFVVQEGQSASDVFQYQLGHMLLPELTLKDIQEMNETEDNRNKVQKAIDKYKSEYPDLYKYVEKTYKNAMLDLNNKNPVFNSKGKFRGNGLVKVPDMSFIINKAQFDQIAQGIKNNNEKK